MGGGDHTIHITCHTFPRHEHMAMIFFLSLSLSLSLGLSLSPLDSFPRSLSLTLLVSPPCSDSIHPDGGQ